MSKMYYGQEVPIVIHKNKDIYFLLFSFGQYSHTKMPPKGYHEKNIKPLITGPHAFLSKNKGTFIRQIFHFLSKSILIFFILIKKGIYIVSSKI